MEPGKVRGRHRAERDVLATQPAPSALLRPTNTPRGGWPTVARCSRHPSTPHWMPYPLVTVEMLDLPSSLVLVPRPTPIRQLAVGVNIGSELIGQGEYVTQTTGRPQLVEGSLDSGGQFFGHRIACESKPCAHFIATTSCCYAS
jgi:hypothetical protein